MKPPYKPRPQHRDDDESFTWQEVAQECCTELSEQGKKKLDAVTVKLVKALQARYKGNTKLFLSPEAAREVIVALIGNGYL